MSRKSVTELRALINTLEGGAKVHELLAMPSLPQGIPRGSLIEVSGQARTEFLLTFLRAHPATKVLWLEGEFKLFPPALRQTGLDLERFVFVETKTEVFSTLRKALRSQVFACVVTSAAFDDERMYKTLRLLTEKAGANCFFFCKEHRPFWSIAMQLQADWNGPRSRALRIEVLRDKSAKTGRFGALAGVEA